MYALPYIILIRLHRAALDARRKDRTWRYYAYSISAGVIASLLVAIALFTAYVMVYIGWWPLAIAMLVFFAAPPLQPVLTRHLFARFGLVRTSYWLAHFVSMQDSDAYGLVCGAWALTGKPSAEGEAWLIARRDKRIPLGDAEIIVTALIAAARGDADTARQLLRSTAGMVEDHPLAREVAGEWLAADCAERGAWAELYADAIAATWPASSLTYFLEGVAARSVEAAGAPGRIEIHARWLLAPHRRATRGLLAPPASPPAPIPPEVSSETAPAADAPSPLVAALAAQVELASDVPDLQRFQTTVRAWDAALLARETATWLAKRAIELDAPSESVSRALKDVTHAVAHELSHLAEQAQLSAPSADGPVGGKLAHRLRHGRLDALEAGFTRWEMRRHDGAVRAPIDEWREFVALRASYDAAIAAGGLELRRLAFPHAYSKGTSMAVWLWNTRKEYAVSHAISTWLLGEALAVGDTEAIDLCTRNTRLTVPTRTGDVKKKA